MLNYERSIYVSLGQGRYIMERPMIIHVQYQDNHYDYVGNNILDSLLNRDRVKRFYGPSEERWVNVAGDPIRVSSDGDYYTGLERRSAS